MWPLFFLAIIQAAYGQSNQTCNDITVGDYPGLDPSMTLAALGVHGIGLYDILTNRDVPVTVLYASDEAIRSGAVRYYPPTANLAQANTQVGSAPELGLYLIVQGAQSPDDLISARELNSALGQAKGQDFTLLVDRDPSSGALLVSSLLPNDTARVIDARQTCNGWAYKLDHLLRPAPYHTDFFNRTLDVPAVQAVLLNGDKCSQTLPQAMARITNTTKWPAAWDSVGLGPVLANETLVATVFVPRDAAVGAKNVSLETLLYNMLPSQRCDRHLVYIGTINSMLGVLTGRNLPLLFTNVSGTIVIKGATNSARMLNTSRACNSLVHTTDAVLVPPPLETAPTRPIKFPISPNRRLTCVPPTMPEITQRTAPSGNFSDLSASDASSGDTDTTLIVGLAVGLGCAVVLLALAIIVMARRHRRKEFASKVKSARHSFGSSTPSSKEHWGALAPATAVISSKQERVAVPIPLTRHGSSGATPTSGSSKTRRSQSSSAFSDSSDMWEINPDDLEVSLGPNGDPLELGRGSFGAVYRGMLRGVQPAAIKVLSGIHDEEHEAAFQSEVIILKRVNRDRNVVQLYGTARMPDGKLLMVTELMDGGNLRAALSRSATGDQLAWQRSGKRVALDIARGLTSLHSNRVAHRDLKSKNILLTNDMTAKIADVGIAAVLEASKGYLTPSSGGVIGTLAWSAPELLLGERCTEKVDIYSLGIILWELGTGAVPQRGLTEPPPPSERCPAELSQLIEECTRRDPESRPTAREVYERILVIPPVTEVCGAAVLNDP